MMKHNNAVKLTVRPVTRLADVGAFTDSKGHGQGARPSRPAAYRGRYAYNLLSDERTEPGVADSQLDAAQVGCERVFQGTWRPVRSVFIPSRAEAGGIQSCGPRGASLIASRAMKFRRGIGSLRSPLTHRGSAGN